MARPKIVDAFCGGGGAAWGYFLAGFMPVGIDLEPQPDYPFEFIQADALAYLEELPRGFSAIHASPPCQGFTPLSAPNLGRGFAYPDLLDRTRALLRASGLPYVIENVPQAPLVDPVTLCGQSFGLRVYRHRSFEASFPILEPSHAQHITRCAPSGIMPDADRPFMTVTGRNGSRTKKWISAAADAMGVPWLASNRNAVCECIPPAYTQYVGTFLMGELSAQLAA